MREITMIERNPDSLKLLATRASVNAYFKKLSERAMEESPNFADIENLMLQPLTTNPDVQGLISPMMMRAVRFQFWPIMIEMFKEEADSINKCFSSIQGKKYKSDERLLIAVQNTLEQHLSHKFSLKTCGVFYMLFDLRCNSVKELKQCANHFTSLGFTENDVQDDFDKMVYTIPEYLEKQFMRFLDRLLESKIALAVDDPDGIDPCQAHSTKLEKIFELGCYYGSDKLINKLFELIDSNHCLLILKKDFAAGSALQMAFMRSHPEILNILLNKWNNLLNSLPAESFNFYQCLRKTLFEAFKKPNLQCLLTLCECCINVSIPIEGASDPQLLTQRLFPLDVTSIFIRESQMPLLDMIAFYYVDSSGFQQNSCIEFLTQFLNHHLQSLEEVEMFQKILQARFQDSIMSDDDRSINGINALIDNLKDNFSEKSCYTCEN